MVHRTVVLVLCVGVCAAQTNAPETGVPGMPQITEAPATPRPSNVRCGIDDYDPPAFVGSGSAIEIMFPFACDVITQWSKDNLPPGTGIARVGYEHLSAFAAYGRSLNEDMSNLWQELLIHESDEVDVLWLDAPWIGPVIDHLEPLVIPDIEKRINPKFYRKNDKGEVISITGTDNQLVMYYRKDIFDKHGATWPKTMLEFDVTVKRVMEAERLERGDDNFWGFLIGTDDSSNRMSYMLATLLTTEDAGMVVEDDGRVSIFNQAAALVISRWRSWFGSITPLECFGMSTGDTRKKFLRSEGLVVLVWTGNSDAMNEANTANPSWDIRVGPIPGRTAGKWGTGCSGDWSIAVSKYSKKKDLAQGWANMWAGVADRQSLSSNDHFPITAVNLTDSAFLDTYCKANPILCNSVKEIPEYWTQQMTHRPSQGCGALYRGCVELIYKHIHPFLESNSRSAEQTLEALQQDLFELLGHVKSTDEDEDESSMKGHRVGLIIVAVIGGILLIIVSFFLYKQQKRMTRASGIPIPALLALIVLVTSCVIAVPLITTTSEVMRDISRDMSTSIRKQSLHTLETTILSTVESLLETTTTSSGIIGIVIAKTKNDIGRIELHAESLVALVDIATGEVLISSDLRRQPEKQVYPNVHPWLRAALAELSFQTKLIDSKLTLSLSVNSKKLFVNQIGIGFGTDKGFIGSSWVLLYVTPEAVIMGEANDAIEKSVDLSVIISIVAVATAVTLASLITKPLVKLAQDMEYVRLMLPEKVVPPTVLIPLRETSSLQRGFDSMCMILREYKAFLPNSILYEESSDLTSESDLMDEGGRRRSSTDDDQSVKVFSMFRRPPNVSGSATIVFTDIQGSTKLWEELENEMKCALHLHNKVFREVISQTNGYEVKTIGDAFMVAFDSAVEGINFCMLGQRKLHENKDWPARLSNKGIWNGFHIRMGCHTGEVQVEESPVTGRADYFGCTVNKAARLEAAAVGGSVAVSPEVLYSLDKEEEDMPHVVSCGPVSLRGIQDIIALSLLIPKSMHKRFKHVEEAAKLKYDRASHVTNPLERERERERAERTERVSTVSTCHSDSSDENRKSRNNRLNVPSALQEKLRKVKSCSIASVKIMLESLAKQHDPMGLVQDIMSTTVGVMERSGSCVFSVCSSSVTTSWNTSNRCASHVENSLRFVTLLQYTTTERRSQCEVKVGVSSGAVFYGNVGASGQRFNMIVGSCVETAGALAAATTDLDVFAMYAAFEGQADVTKDSAVRYQVRPVDTWQLSGCADPVPIFQIRDKSDSMVRGFSDDPDSDWGWGDEYKEAFANKNVSAIRANAGEDVVLLKVAAKLSEVKKE